MAEEAVTTLRAELGNFARAEVAFALLEAFLDVAGPWVGEVVLDPRRLLLPDEMTDDRAVMRQVIDELDREPLPKSGPFTAYERGFDVTDEQARWDYARLAYCSHSATVWSRGRRTTYFEVVDRSRATYWLPDSLKEQYFDRLAANGWAIPDDWLAAAPKKPKPWWKRGRI